MQIEVKIDKKYIEPKIIIVADKLTDELNMVIRNLSNNYPSSIVGFKDGLVEILNHTKIYRVFALNGKVFAETKDNKYLIRLRLYEVEEYFDNQIFVRISNSEIINLKKVKEFDLSFTGTICVKFLNGTITYVSRRYVSKVKKVLKI